MSFFKKSNDLYKLYNVISGKSSEIGQYDRSVSISEVLDQFSDLAPPFVLKVVDETGKTRQKWKYDPENELANRSRGGGGNKNNGRSGMLVINVEDFKQLKDDLAVLVPMFGMVPINSMGDLREYRQIQKEFSEGSADNGNAEMEMGMAILDTIKGKAASPDPNNGVTQKRSIVDAVIDKIDLDKELADDETRAMTEQKLYNSMKKSEPFRKLVYDVADKVVEEEMAQPS